MQLRAITIWQPYASLIVLGLKRFETRSWSTRWRGTLVIHSASRCDWFVRHDITRVQSLIHEPANGGLWSEAGLSESQRRLARTRWDDPCLYESALGFVQLTDCRQMMDSGSRFENEVGQFGPGRYGWELDEPVAFEQPIPDRGQQGLWVPSFAVEAEVRAEMSVL